MEELKSIIDSLEIEIRNLLERNKNLIAQNRALEGENMLLKNIKAEHELEINSLTDEKQAMLLSGAFLRNSSDERVAQEAIEKILREIDDCIALVNR